MVDVIIPAHLPTKKHIDLFDRALKSLERQTYKNFNVFVVFNGLFQNEEDILKNIKYNNIIFHSFNGKQSAAKARNFAFKMGKSEYVAQLDADDQFHPEKLEKQLNFMLKNEKIDFLGTLAYDLHENNKIIDSCYKPHQYETHDQISKIINFENVMCNGSVMFKRSSFEQLGGYKENLKPGELWPDYGRNMWEDWDLYIRACENGMILHNLPERLYYWSAGTGVER